MRRYSYMGLVVFLAAMSVLLWQMDGNGYAAQPAGYIALTFDDGPHGIYTQQLLDGLEERNVQVSFFLLGENIRGNEEIVQRMEKAGHLIGNHTYRHIQLTMANQKDASEYVKQTNQMIADITGMTPEYLRPPYGAWNEELDCLVNMNMVFWSVDT